MNMNALLTKGKLDLFILCVFCFQIYGKMSSTGICALILLACALTFSAAQSEYNYYDICIS